MTNLARGRLTYTGAAVLLALACVCIWRGEYEHGVQLLGFAASVAGIRRALATGGKQL